ncbi:hypothetical protein N431DRAFT_502644 [Stipitochalara longipes BDJ]|nr:hypothetical protein N431DRAFT_502644 [Stipitochalara longipes BDJ]
MASTKVYTPSSELPTAMKEAAEDPNSTTDCGVPGCFTCANGEKHALLLTPFDEYLLIMQNHKEALRRGMANTKGRIAVIKSERLDTDLESGHFEQKELEQVIYDYEEALESDEDCIAYAKRAGMYEHGAYSKEEEEEQGEIEEEEELEDESELAKDKENILDDIASEYQPSHGDIFSSKLAGLRVMSETEEEKGGGGRDAPTSLGWLS